MSVVLKVYYNSVFLIEDVIGGLTEEVTIKAWKREVFDFESCYRLTQAASPKPDPECTETRSTDFCSLLYSSGSSCVFGL